MTEREQIDALRTYVEALEKRLNLLERCAVQRAWFGADRMTDEERQEHAHNQAMALFGLPMP